MSKNTTCNSRFQHPSTLYRNILFYAFTSILGFLYLSCTWPECIFHFNQGIAAVCQQILGFSGVNPDHSDQKVTGSPQTNFHLQRHFQTIPTIFFYLKKKSASNNVIVEVLFCFFICIPWAKSCLLRPFPNCTQKPEPWLASVPSVLLTKSWREAPGWM